MKIQTMRYNQTIVAPQDVANTLNDLKSQGKQICYIIPTHECDVQPLVIIIYAEVI